MRLSLFFLSVFLWSFQSFLFLLVIKSQRGRFFFLFLLRRSRGGDCAFVSCLERLWGVLHGGQ